MMALDRDLRCETSSRLAYPFSEDCVSAYGMGDLIEKRLEHENGEVLSTVLGQSQSD